MPGIGSGFYHPGRADFYSGAAQSTAQNVPTQSESTPAEQKTTSTETKAKAAQTENLYWLSELGAPGGFSSQNQQLTAWDIASLDGMGLVGSLSTLTNRKQNLPTTDSALLAQILTELSELKAKVMADGQNRSETLLPSAEKSDKPHILRFNVNGTDILPTCRNIFVSSQETNGSFLITGDRKFFSDGAGKNETFYFYFRANGNKNGITTYSVAPVLSQDSENAQSPLYKLTQKNSLTANRTGNFVTVRETDSDWNIDILISLDA